MALALEEEEKVYLFVRCVCIYIDARKQMYEMQLCSSVCERERRGLNVGRGRSSRQQQEIIATTINKQTSETTRASSISSHHTVVRAAMAPVESVTVVDSDRAQRTRKRSDKTVRRNQLTCL